jgi:hypothetical protein
MYDPCRLVVAYPRQHNTFPDTGPIGSGDKSRQNVQMYSVIKCDKGRVEQVSGEVLIVERG